MIDLQMMIHAHFHTLQLRKDLEIEAWKVIRPTDILLKTNFSTISQQVLSKYRKIIKNLKNSFPRVGMQPPNNSVSIPTIGVGVAIHVDGPCLCHVKA